MPTFSKQERLKSRKTIAMLFKGGNSFVAYPMRVVWVETPPYLAERKGHDARIDKLENEAHRASESTVIGAQLAISVPKRTFKTAVARNRIKRRIREAYRLHKHELYEKLAGRHIAFMMVYIAKESLPFAEIEGGVKKMIRKFPA
jgi:ribonuclease P protein component